MKKHNTKHITIALAGNPNAGKTTLFNALTGAHYHVGNYPGVTVEKKEGILRHKGYTVTVVDLPGIYSLSSYSLDEVVARDFLIHAQPDAVIDVIDTGNLERNLYLAIQLKELQVPLILAFNMYDESLTEGMEIDLHCLKKLLHCPIIPTIATKKEGIQELLDEIIAGVESNTLSHTPVWHGREIEEEISKIEQLLIADPETCRTYPARWAAIKLLENDQKIIKDIKGSGPGGSILEQTGKSIQHLRTIFNDTPEAVIADSRYGFISGSCSEAIQRSVEMRHSVSDQIDRILLNRTFGFPILLLLVWLMFQFTFKASRPFIAAIQLLQGYTGDFFTRILPDGSWLQSLIVDALIGGVGSVLVFLPAIFLLFFAMAFFEDSGYMARAAFIMDNFMHAIGLHGRSFIPMLLGFGCNAVAIMSTRTISDPKDRMVTILVNPFISCSARIPVYILLIGAFFPAHYAGNVLFSLYIASILTAAGMSALFRTFLFKGAAAPFVMELPPYRTPTLKGLLIHMWERGSGYLQKAGTIIFVGSVLMWFLTSFPAQSKKQTTSAATAGLENSYAGTVGKIIAPVFKPLGFGDWKIANALMSGVIAKENVVSTLGTIYAAGSDRKEKLQSILSNETNPNGEKKYSPLTAYALLVFILLYLPCLATLAVIKKETNTWRWPIFTAVYTTGVAWIVSFLVFQGGRLLGFQ